MAPAIIARGQKKRKIPKGVEGIESVKEDSIRTAKLPTEANIRTRAKALAGRRNRQPIQKATMRMASKPTKPRIPCSIYVWR